MLKNWENNGTEAIALVPPTPGAFCNMGYPSETALQLKSREDAFAWNVLLSYPIALTFCAEHGSITTVLCE